MPRVAIQGRTRSGGRGNRKKGTAEPLLGGGNGQVSDGGLRTG